MTLNLPPAQETELTLIAQDANDLLRAVLGRRGESDAGMLAYSTVGLTGLVVEECSRYLAGAPANAGLRLGDTELFEKFSRTVTKARARIKLFDDNEGYADGLVEALSIAHAKSIEWFGEPHRGFFRSWIRLLQPDLGAFFSGEHLFATTHTILPSIGMPIEELTALTPTKLKSLGQRFFEFSYEVGKYFSQLANLFESFGKHIELDPHQLSLETFASVTMISLALSFIELQRRRCGRAKRDS